jgi:putative transposase
VHYCYFNPVKHRLVTNVEDWPYSTFHRDVTAGFVPTDWEAIDGEFGEREETGKRRAD